MLSHDKKIDIYIYVYIIHLFNKERFGGLGDENTSTFSGSFDPQSNEISSFLPFYEEAILKIKEAVMHFYYS